MEKKLSKLHVVARSNKMASMFGICGGPWKSTVRAGEGEGDEVAFVTQGEGGAGGVSEGEGRSWMGSACMSTRTDISLIRASVIPRLHSSSRGSA